MVTTRGSADRVPTRWSQAKEVDDIIATVPEQTLRDIFEVQDNVRSKFKSCLAVVAGQALNQVR